MKKRKVAEMTPNKQNNEMPAKRQKIEEIFNGVPKQLLAKSKIEPANVDLMTFILDNSAHIKTKNWSAKGSAVMDQVRKLDSNFIIGICHGRTLSDESLHTFGSSPGIPMDRKDNPKKKSQDQVEEETNNNISDDRKELSRDISKFLTVKTHKGSGVISKDDLWRFIISYVHDNDLFVEFEFEMNDEKWFEVKRAEKNVFLNEEAFPDILLKFSLREDEDGEKITYYIHCLGNLVKTGEISTKQHVSQLYDLMSRNRYICAGLDCKNLLAQCDVNIPMREIIQEEGCFVRTPYTALYAKRCKMIVKSSTSVRQSTIRRMEDSLNGFNIICRSCHELLSKLTPENFPVSTYNEIENRMNSENMFMHIPLRKLKTDQRVKDLFSTSAAKYVEESSYSQNTTERMGMSLAQFETSVNIQRRGETKNRNVCNLCGFKAKSMLVIFKHLSEHLGPKVVPCSRCDLQFATQTYLTRHIKESHPQTPSKCHKCFVSLPSEADLAEHMNAHSDHKPYRCHICNSANQDLQSHKKHMVVAHHLKTVKEINLKCNVCDLYFYTRNHLIIHKYNDDHIGDRNLICAVCSSECGNKNDFVDHLKCHHSEAQNEHNLLMCKHCQKLFFSQAKLVLHVGSKHKNIQDRKDNLSESSEMQCPVCPICNSSFENQSKLAIHSRYCGRDEDTENVAQIFSICDICGYKCLSKARLEKHMVLHKTRKRITVFECPYCKATYKDKRAFKTHIINAHPDEEFPQDVEVHSYRKNMKGKQKVIKNVEEKLDIQEEELDIQEDE